MLMASAPSPRPLVWTAMGILGLSGCLPPPRDQGTRPQGPNLLVLCLDGVRADHLGSYGYPRRATPHMDGLAEGGLRFDDIITPSPWSRPAFAALMTGRYPSHLNLAGEAQAMDAGAVTLARLLRERGYNTGAVLSHPFLNAASGVGEGFADYTFTVERDGWPKGLSSGRVVDQALEWLDDQASGAFFLMAHFADCLHDWAPVEGLEFGDPQYEGPLAGGLRLGDLMAGRRVWDDADLAELCAHYDSELAYLDDQLGRLLEGMNQRGLLQDSLILLTSTHGMELFDHGGVGSAQSLYDELIHVPLILWGPGVAPGLNEVSGSLIDVVPTLCEALDIDTPEDLDGQALQGLDVMGNRVLFCETDRIRRRRAAIGSRYKLVVDLESNQRQLFDLLDDPAETHDLSGDPAALGHLAVLEDALGRFMGQ